MPGTYSLTSLSDRPSEMLRQAVEDLLEIEKDADYLVNMSQWHAPDRRCGVCMAGAVMSRRCAVLQYDEHCLPSDFVHRDKLKLIAIDHLRVGSIWLGLGYLNVCADDLPEQISVNEYHENRTGFLEDMKKISDMLEDEGL